MRTFVFQLRRFVLLTAVIFVSGCGGGDGWKEFVGIKPDRTRNIVVLVDLSADPSNPDRHQYYKGVLTKEIWGALRVDDRITVLPVDRSSVTNAEEIFLLDFSKQDFKPGAGNPLDIPRETQINLDKFKETKLPELESSFDRVTKARQPFSQETDLFGAFESVRRYSMPDRPTYVILLSDMMNYTSSLSMEPSNKNFVAAEIEQLVDSAPDVNMTGYIVLALTGDQSQNKTTHWEAVKLFWQTYLPKHGGILKDYSSASRSKVDELLRTAAGK